MYIILRFGHCAFTGMDYCRCNGTGQSCVSSCKFLDDGGYHSLLDGNYQSCSGCKFFATCSYGVFYDEQPCEGDGPYWDDNLKKCVNQSSTCKYCSNDETTTTAAITTYPKSKTARSTTVTTQPTTANNPPTSVKTTTSTTLVKTTTQATTKPTTTEAKTSTTVITNPTDTTTTPSTKRTTLCTTGPTCITVCQGKANGVYQSCEGCHVYANCSRGKLKVLPCQSYGLYWDDNLKMCENKSETCKRCPYEETTTSVTTNPTHAATTERTTVCTSGPLCITNCTNQADGDYQLCKGCHVYATCSYKQLKESPCKPDVLYWDDDLKKCANQSKTCKRCPNEKTTTAVTTNPTPVATTTSEICPTDRPHISSCCSVVDDGSCSNKLFYRFLCWLISHP